MVGRQWSKLMTVAVVAAAICCGGPASASAEGEPETGAFNAFVIKASNGYTMRVLALSETDYRKGEILILLSGKRGAVGYFSPATVTDTKIDAELGELGRISLDFVPSGQTKRLRTGCDGGPATFEGGSYVGTIEFRGEEGYAAVRAARVPFTPRPLIELICGADGEGEGLGPGLPGARLRAIAGRGANETSLQVNQNHPAARVRVEAAIEERRGPILIAREVEFSYPKSAFHFDRELRSAVFKPPAPFSGSAVYRREARPGGRWTGSLAVDFPGDANVRLAGSRFRASLVRARLTFDRGRAARPNLSSWPSTKPSPTAFATSSLLGPS